DRAVGYGVRAHRIARIEVESVAIAGGHHTEESRGLRGDHEGMRRSAKCGGKASFSDAVLLAVSVVEDLALDDVDGVVGQRVHVQRRHLAPDENVLERVDPAARFLAPGVPAVHAAAGEPAPFSLAAVVDDDSGL